MDLVDDRSIEREKGKAGRGRLLGREKIKTVSISFYTMHKKNDKTKPNGIKRFQINKHKMFKNSDTVKRFL